MNSSGKLLIDSCRVCGWFLTFKPGQEPITEPIFSYVINCNFSRSNPRRFLPENDHEMSDLLFTRAGIGLTEVNRVKGISHGIITGVFETELFRISDC